MVLTGRNHAYGVQRAEASEISLQPDELVLWDENMGRSSNLRQHVVLNCICWTGEL